MSRLTRPPERPLDFTRPVRTKCGHSARIYAVHERGDRPVHGAVQIAGEWLIASWAADGSHSRMPDFSLVQVEPDTADLRTLLSRIALRARIIADDDIRELARRALKELPK